MIEKIISGGQTGADQGALEAARIAGVDTGGTAPRGYRTEAGPNFALRDVYGLETSDGENYPPRTEMNVKAADATAWFGTTTSPGFRATKAFCGMHKKPFWVNKDAMTLHSYCRRINARILNVAGNRESKNRGIRARTSSVIAQLLALDNPQSLQ